MTYGAKPEGEQCGQPYGAKPKIFLVSVLAVAMIDC